MIITTIFVSSVILTAFLNENKVQEHAIFVRKYDFGASSFPSIEMRTVTEHSKKRVQSKKLCNFLLHFVVNALTLLNSMSFEKDVSPDDTEFLHTLLLACKVHPNL